MRVRLLIHTCDITHSCRPICLYRLLILFCLYLPRHLFIKKNPYILCPKHLHLSQKRPTSCAKGLYISRKSVSYRPQKSPIPTAKEPYILCKRAQHLARKSPLSCAKEPKNSRPQKSVISIAKERYSVYLSQKSPISRIKQTSRSQTRN